MNQIAIFGVALLIAYAVGVPVANNVERSLSNEVEDADEELATIDTPTLSNDNKYYASCSGGKIFKGQKMCILRCGYECMSLACGGFKKCEKIKKRTYKCHCNFQSLPGVNGTILENPAKNKDLSTSENKETSLSPVISQDYIADENSMEDADEELAPIDTSTLSNDNKYYASCPGGKIFKGQKMCILRCGYECMSLACGGFKKCDKIAKRTYECHCNGDSLAGLNGAIFENPASNGNFSVSAN